MSVRTDKLIETLRDRAFRDRFSEDQIYELLALQVRQLRERNGWTQEELGSKIGLVQSAIARAENPDYTGSTISTLSKLAHAFDVALIVHFAPFSELADWLSRLSSTSFEPESFEDEARMWSSKTRQGEFGSDWMAENLSPGAASNIICLTEHKRDWRVAGERSLSRVEGVYNASA